MRVLCLASSACGGRDSAQTEASDDAGVGARSGAAAEGDAGTDGPTDGGNVVATNDAKGPTAVDAAHGASPCGADTCATGCCDTDGVCQPGTTIDQCGSGGTACQSRLLQAGRGGNGCCDFQGACQQGLADLACGNSGAECVDCGGVGEVCSNQACAYPSASAACERTCAGCCDPLGNCAVGTSDTTCGRGGELCANCSAVGAQCQYNTCFAPDGGSTCFDTCDGCCDALGNCQFGLLDTQCGTAGPGSACQDCTRLTPPSTCDVGARVCASQQTACPAAYTGCPAALTEEAPVRQHVCSMDDLQNVAAPCAGGVDTAACVQFQFAEDPACLGCLQIFAFQYPCPGNQYLRRGGRISSSRKLIRC